MLAADSALVAGALAPAAVRTTVVRVVRPFFIAAQRHERGEILDLDWRLAQELMTANKAERAAAGEAGPAAVDQRPSESPPPPRESAPAESPPSGRMQEARTSASLPDEEGKAP